MPEEKVKIPVVAATASDLISLLNNGATTSVDIVTAYLNHIDSHNRRGLGLRALISVIPREKAIAQAITLDKERQAGHVRSPLHGLPIVVKDNICTAADLGMTTTAGAYAFKDTYARDNAPVIDTLFQAGLIVIGKAALTEFCGLRGTMMTAGYSAVNGQTQSPWIRGGKREDDFFCGRSTPGGSSAGSAVSVAAGFAPFALGTDTSGSVSMPAGRNGLWSLKPTFGAIKGGDVGIQRLSRDYDSVGAMARSADDLKLLMEVLTSTSLMPELERALAWPDLKVGFVDPKKWLSWIDLWDRADAKQILKDYEWAKRQISQKGAKVVDTIVLITTDQVKHQELSICHTTAFLQFPDLFKEFTASLLSPPVNTVEELIEYNNKNAAVAMPEPHRDQTDLIATLTSPWTDEIATAAVAFGREAAGPRGIDACLRENDIDLILGPGDCSICSLATLAGYPSAMVPLGVLDSEEGMGQPQGLMVIGSKGSDARILGFMKLWTEVVGRNEVATLMRDLHV